MMQAKLRGIMIDIQDVDYLEVKLMDTNSFIALKYSEMLSVDGGFIQPIEPTAWLGIEIANAIVRDLYNCYTNGYNDAYRR